MSDWSDSVLQPWHITYYRAFDLILLAINVALFSTTTCAIMQTPARYMRTYRFFILHEIAWAMGFDVATSLFVPIVHLPHICYQSGGFWKESKNKLLNWTMVYTLITFCMGKSLAMFFCCFYRFLKAVEDQDGRFFRRYIKYRYPQSPICYGVVFAVFIGSVMTVLTVFTSDPTESTRYVKEHHADTALVLQLYPAMVCMSPTKDYRIVLIFPLFLLAMWAFTMVLLLLLLVFMLNRKRNVFEARTLHLQYMLFKSLVAQLGAAIALVNVPLVVWLVCGILNYQNSLLVSWVCLSLLGLHSSADCIVILVYVRPFRLAVSRLFRRITTSYAAGVGVESGRCRVMPSKVCPGRDNTFNSTR